MAEEYVPILTDETGKQIVAVLGMIAKKDISIFNNWDSVADIVNSGGASSVFSVGDRFNEKYINVDNQNKEYDMPWHINDFRDFELEDGDTVHGMILQSEYATLQGIQFTNVRAFLACPDGLTKGTYHVTLGENWGTNAKKGKTYQFTLTKDVPENGRLAGFKYMPDSAPSGWKVYSYLADGITLAETVDVTEGSNGTDLGTMAYNTRTGNLNSMQETAYGRNRWATSAMRQWLNSSKGKGAWWTPQDQWDIAPDQLANTSGFLCGLPEDFIKKMKKVKVVTAKNTVAEGGGTEVTYDRVFLPSLEEINMAKQVAGEGAVHDYWKQRSGSSKPMPLYTNNERYIHYALENHSSAQYVLLRSACVGVAVYTWHVSSSGFVNLNTAANAWRCVPLIVI